MMVLQLRKTGSVGMEGAVGHSGEEEEEAAAESAAAISTVSQSAWPVVRARPGEK
jgi:hypothetical protein